MGLASALSTALTGMNAAETTIDVVGNNLANSSTVGFKASEANFATQFLQTRGLGSAPTENSGGTNPRQIGLGVLVAEITPDFSQGTIEVSASPSDLAIQGDGFFMVQSSGGEQLYTRNGIFKTNSENELVTIAGNRLLGYGIDDDFAIQATTLEPITIPLGSAAVAEATENVSFGGVLTPTGDLATTAEIIESAVLGDANFTTPIPLVGSLTGTAPPPAGTFAGTPTAGPGLPNGTYHYKIVLVDGYGNESPAATTSVDVVGTASNIVFGAGDLPTGTNPPYVDRIIYRTAAGAGVNGPYYEVDLANTIGDATTSGPFTDAETSNPPPGPSRTFQDLSGAFTYYITYTAPGVPESRPVRFGNSITVTNGRALLTDLPAPTGNYAVPGAKVAIYRNLSTNSNLYYRVDEITVDAVAPPGLNDFVDGKSDAQLLTANVPLDFNGPKANPSTRLIDVTIWNGSTYTTPFVAGELAFRATKGGTTFSDQTLTISDTLGSETTVAELANFMAAAFGIHTSADDPAMPTSLDLSGGPALAPGAYPDGLNGTIRFVGNNGVANAVAVNTSAFTMTSTTGVASSPELSFDSVQEAVGQSAAASFIVYDSLGIELDVRVTAVLESSDGSATTYRWFADSPENDPITGTDITIGTGLIRFDGNGNLLPGSDSTIAIDRSSVASVSPLQINLDFSSVSGLAADNATLSAAFRDGFAAGTLSSYIVGEDGVITGVFTNGASRTLGQVRLARFANPAGLEARGQNLFALGVNSGLPIEGNPGENGIGGLVAGATELSNTDIGKNLIDLILASTQYRGNTRVITTSQQLFDELLNLRR
jgi:flagellar hook protein FlgE